MAWYSRTPKRVWIEMNAYLTGLRLWSNTDVQRENQVSFCIYIKTALKHWSSLNWVPDSRFSGDWLHNVSQYFSCTIAILRLAVSSFLDWWPIQALMNAIAEVGLTRSLWILTFIPWKLLCCFASFSVLLFRQRETLTNDHNKRAARAIPYTERVINESWTLQVQRFLFGETTFFTKTPNTSVFLLNLPKVIDAKSPPKGRKTENEQT